MPLPQALRSTPTARGLSPLELRSDPRVGVDFPVDVYTTDLPGPLPGRTRDLGVGGVCVVTPSSFAIKAICRVVLTLPSGVLQLEAGGQWQREVPAEDLVLTGIRFHDPPEAAVDVLWEIVIQAGKQLARFLHHKSDLKELGLEEAMGLAQVSRLRNIPTGGWIYRQDTAQPGEDSIFIITRGTVVLQTRVRDAREVMLARLSVGEMFGGLPLFGDVPHAESAVAETDLLLFEVDRGAYGYMRGAKPWLAHRLAQAGTRSYARHLREVLTRLRDRL